MSMQMPETRPNVQLPLDEDELDLAKRALRGFIKHHKLGNTDDPETKTRMRRLADRIDRAQRRLVAEHRENIARKIMDL